MVKAPRTLLKEGDVIVRVGADCESCPRGRTHHLYPVIQLIWPSLEDKIIHDGGISLRWQDKLDAGKPSKSSSPKYIGLVLDSGIQWVGYRVSDADRQMFESLRKKWGMWFLRTSRQGEEEKVLAYFNDGGHFPGAILNSLRASAHVK